MVGKKSIHLQYLTVVSKILRAVAISVGHESVIPYKDICFKTMHHIDSMVNNYNEAQNNTKEISQEKYIVETVFIAFRFALETQIQVETKQE